ncbi:DEAD/DEAH box helicase family protein [Halanaerocella petrolearia]
MPVDHSEETLEEAIEKSLLKDGGYTKGYSQDFDKAYALDTKTLFKFLKESQPQKWQELKKVHGDKIKEKLLQRLDRVIKKRGMLNTLREGITDYGVHFDLVYFAPANNINSKTMELYRQNKLKITRQLYYSNKNQNSLDMMLSVNGLPLITIELKNQFTNQTVEDAKVQYKKDRNSNERLFQFNKRALVHFAVDTDEAYMTTKLAGDNTSFLPFNRGHNKGAGNPPNPNGYKTSYLWQDVWQKDSLLDILARFMHLKEEEKTKNGETYTKQIMIFPRFHQLDAVRKLIFDMKEYGAGKNYLVQHSTGSGKSISIAWLAHHLSSLHNRQDELIFNSVIVITDRRVLDKQLQDTIYQFERTSGVVEKIDEDSSQLAQSLEDGAKIIITTLHKFPYVLDKIGELPERNYAVIADEGHRSQSGTLSESLKKVLSSQEEEESKSYQDEILEDMDKKGQKDNLSFFAFTATPKDKTLQKFGTETKDGQKKPFHLYSMRQAIEEGFILDVLQNYTTYNTYYRLAKRVEDDPELDKKKAKKAIAEFVSLHPHNIKEKTQVMVEHYNRVTKDKINGKAKAMVVTSSRLHAVRYKLAFDKYIKEQGFKDVNTVVAFSGTVTDPDTGKEYTEEVMNQFSQDELPKKFATDKYQILIVANKYQTGFDQPLLHTMYVDKKLSGLSAVQTLSRLNRTHKGKHDTFVLDFVNEIDTIKKSYQPYYEQTILEEPTDPNLLYDLKYKLDDFQVYWDSEIEKFNSVFFKPEFKQKPEDQGALNSYIDPAVDRFKELPEEEQHEFKSTLTTYVRQYSFLSQIVPFNDPELHKLHAYGKFLLRKLPKKDKSANISLDNDVTLEYYRLDMTQEQQDISLVKEDGKLKGATDIGTGSPQEEEKTYLSKVIEMFNEHFGTDFSEADKLFVDQIEEDMIADEKLAKQARNNSKDNFKYAIEREFNKKLFKRMDKNQKMFTKIMNDDDLQDALKEYLLEKVYDALSVDEVEDEREEISY